MKPILIVATEEGRSKTVIFLLELGAKVDAKDKHGQTSLMYVCRSPRPRSSYTVGSLMAAWDGDTDHEITTSLLKAGADVETTNDEQETPLILASKNGLLRIASLLLEEGANIEAKDSLEHTSLAIASQGGFFKIVSLLLERGADIETFGFGTFRKGEFNPLQMASRHGHHTIVNLLISKGACVDAKKAHGDSALLWLEQIEKE